MKAKVLKIDKLRTDGGTQQRAATNPDHVAELAEWLKAEKGRDLPPVKAVFDGGDYWLWDGFHTTEAYKAAGRDIVPAEVTEGTQREAVLLSCSANASHGLKRTNADKRKAVETLLNDAEWVQQSDGWIAARAAVSKNFVGVVRKELSSDDSSQVARAADRPRRGLDGKLRKTPPKQLASNASSPEVNGSLKEQVDADLTTEEEADEPSVEEVIKEENALLESWCRELMELGERMPDTPWLRDMNRREGAVAKLKGAAETVRSAKCHCACPACQGQGCKKCHNSGRVTKYAYQQIV